MNAKSPPCCPRLGPFLLAGAALLYVLAVAGFAVWSYNEDKTRLLAEIDGQLLQAARSLKYLLAPDFHDRALAADSIAKDEELRNRKAVTEFGVESGFKWVYTLVEKDGAFFFAAPSVSDEEALERDSWYFYPYDDLPEEFAAAYRSGQPVFVEYEDQWGTFRSVALPERSPGGRPYLACADRDIGEIMDMLRDSSRQSLAIAVFFVFAGLPFVAFLVHHFRSNAAALRKLNAELLAHQEHLEDLVRQRTADLEKETRRLQEALDNIQTLSGLLPICSSCKKIRDDQGYWRQVELFVAQHTGARFTHGLCPECEVKLYGEIAGQG